MTGNPGTAKLAGCRSSLPRNLVYRALTLLAVASVAAFIPRPAHAGPYHSQIWGKLVNTTTGFWGVSALKTTMNPNISSGFAAGPTAVGQGNVGGAEWPLIEAGPEKDCDKDCIPHPYVSSIDANGVWHGSLDTSDVLAAGGTYGYEAIYLGGTNWAGLWEDGSGGITLGIFDLATDLAQPAVASGGEAGYGGAFTSAPIGTIYQSQDSYWDTSDWIPYCYGVVWNNVGGTITSCGSNYDWTVSYGS
jgi:hypothetical protein